MWYEIIPSVAIVLACVSSPFLIYPGWNYIISGKIRRRSVVTGETKKLTMRDERLTGDCYKTIGLEGIPDK